jgi:septal ring factor EnvC (AmiA/AmiB activator)
VRDAIGKAVQLRQSVVDVDRDIATRTQRVAEITSEQNRIRENMKTVAPSTQYYSRLLEKLNEQESAIESLQKERDALTAKRDALRRELDDYLGGLMVG